MKDIILELEIPNEEKKLAEVTIKIYKERIEKPYNNSDSDAKFKAVFHAFKHCLIFKLNSRKFVNELLFLDQTFAVAIIMVSREFDELKI